MAGELDFLLLQGAPLQLHCGVAPLPSPHHPHLPPAGALRAGHVVADMWGTRGGAGQALLPGVSPTRRPAGHAPAPHGCRPCLGRRPLFATPPRPRPGRCPFCDMPPLFPPSRSLADAVHLEKGAPAQPAAPRGLCSTVAPVRAPPPRRPCALGLKASPRTRPDQVFFSCGIGCGGSLRTCGFHKICVAQPHFLVATPCGTAFLRAREQISRDGADTVKRRTANH